MSGLGLIVLLLFVFSTGGIIMMYYNGNADLGLTKLMFGIMQLLAVVEVLLCFAEFPLYVIDGIVFASMGVEMLRNVMLIIYAAVILFTLVMILPKLKWKQLYTVKLGKIIICGIIIICALVYTEMFNGIYSFEDKADFYTINEQYSQYDDGFFPVKLIEKEYDGETHYSVYPFDAHSAAGELDFIYRGEICFRPDDTGVNQAYFYPFNLEVALGLRDPVAFSDPTYIPASRLPKEVSPTDTEETQETEQQTEAAQ